MSLQHARRLLSDRRCRTPPIIAHNSQPAPLAAASAVAGTAEARDTGRESLERVRGGSVRHIVYRALLLEAEPKRRPHQRCV